MSTLYTIGHSNHALEPFLDALAHHEIARLVDVRSYPASRYVPHFDRAPLKAALERYDIGYLFMGGTLGGRSPHFEHYRDGKLDYGLLLQSEAFSQGLHSVEELAQEERIALMCSEEDPLRCHRGVVIGRYFHERGWQVLHIRGSDEIEDHTAFEERLQGNERGTQLSLWKAPTDLADSYHTQEHRIAPEYRSQLGDRS